MSGGRMTVDVFPTGELYPTVEGLDAIAAGVTELAVMAAYYVGKVGPASLFEGGVPGGDKTAVERFNFFYREGFLEVVRDMYSQHGVYYISPHLSSGWHLYSKFPVTGKESFEGKKIRVYGIEASWYQSMGASTVLLPGEELYTALATGVIDASRWGSPAATIGMGLHEQAPYVVFPASMPAPNNFYMVNPNSWNSLSPDLQAILERCAMYSGFDYYVTQSAYDDQAALNKMISEGATKNVISDDAQAEMDALAREAWDAAATDELSKKVVQMLRDYMVKLGR
jgi:TRAP-type mannitol/chloroaromatic compound transport system substrate-binding protein